MHVTLSEHSTPYFDSAEKLVEGFGSDLPAVCTYNVTVIGDVFNRGTYKAPIRDTYPEKWQTYYEEIPDLHPGAPLRPSSQKHLFHRDSLAILDTISANSGIHECQAVERVKGWEYTRTISAIQLKPRKEDIVLAH
ncbi:hypothetical protein JZ751_021312 [Albula glossodonta]|uniref:Uncharacterized protein n=1 Tax=Albula glossodonta TaxID=121402 RepID=A0A8T2NIK0_9TELE|nr:hypothetical protein JZ751_021312 [Albula glossodonta]